MATTIDDRWYKDGACEYGFSESGIEELNYILDAAAEYVADEIKYAVEEYIIGNYWDNPDRQSDDLATSVLTGGIKKILIDQCPGGGVGHFRITLTTQSGEVAHFVVDAHYDDDCGGNFTIFPSDFISVTKEEE